MTVRKTISEKNRLMLLLRQSASNSCHTVGHKSLDCPQNAMRGGKGRDRQFRGGKGGGGKAKEVVVPATKEKVIGNQKQAEVISKVVVYVFVVVLRGIRLNIARMRKNLLKR